MCIGEHLEVSVQVREKVSRDRTNLFYHILGHTISTGSCCNSVVMKRDFGNPRTVLAVYADSC